jgi:hypothetical protein
MRLVVVALLFLIGVARADVGVVVAGDPNMQTPVLNAVQHWVQAKHQKLVAAPLGEGTTAMVDCFVMEDVACARKTFEAHAKSATVIFVRIDVPTAERSYLLHAYWFTRGRAPLHETKSCGQCDDAKLAVTVDGILDALVHKAVDGKGMLEINGSGDIQVQLDGADLGTAPIKQEVPMGSHELVFVHSGSPIGVRRIEVDEGALVAVAVPHLPAPAPAKGTGGRSRTLPITMTLLGLAATAAGGTLLYYGSLRGPDEPYVYTNATEIGLPVALAGAVAFGAGTALWITAGDSAANVGVQGSF